MAWAESNRIRSISTTGDDRDQVTGELRLDMLGRRESLPALALFRAVVHLSLVSVPHHRIGGRVELVCWGVILRHPVLRSES